MSQETKALKDRVEARKHELLSKFNDLKADTRTEAASQRTKLKAKLDEVETYLKDGWDKMSSEVSSKLDGWLKHDKDDKA
ncbi:MAG TPA: hypothetical protein VGM88_20560 [Kofleriaceae bacterium]|jgi:hypothetical protein